MVVRWTLLAVLLACGEAPQEAPVIAGQTTAESPSPGAEDAVAGSEAASPPESSPPDELFGAPVMGDASKHREVEPDPDQSRSTEADILQARELIEEKRVDEALTLLQRAIEARPQDPDAHYWLGRAHELMGDHALAVQAMLQATSIDPEFASAWWSVGFNYTFQRRCADALPAQTRYIELRPEDSGGYYNRASCRWYTQDREGSLEDGNKACEMGHPMACQHVEKQLRRQEMLEAFEAKRAAGLEDGAP